MKLPFLWVDAFTKKPFGGNPCAVVFDAENLSGDDMSTIAKEFNLSETAFVTGVEENRVSARYFTPAEEIPMAGHPTISTIFALRKTKRIASDVTSVELKLPAGLFEVNINADDSGCESISMRQNPPQFLKEYDRLIVARIFSLQEEDLLSGLPAQTVSTGTPQLMVPIKNLDSLRKARLDVDLYLELKNSGDFFSPHLFCLQGATSRGQTFARHFGVPPDTLEDPFTGSATGGMAAYIWKNRLFDETQIIAEQGFDLGRPGEAAVKLIGTPDNIQGIEVSGSAVEIMSGSFRF